MAGESGTQFKVGFISHNRKAKCAPDPAYPQGIDADLTDGAKVACLAELPYPAECCGVWLVECLTCGIRAGITAAGRPDDPRSAKLACKL
jgi:hypothetical protein